MKILLLILFLLVNLSLYSTSDAQNQTISWPTNLTIGFLINAYNWRLYDLTCRIALEDLKRDLVVPADFKPQFHWRQVTDDATAMNASLELFRKKHVDAYFGPESVLSMSITALMAANLDLPAYAYAVVSSDLQDKKKYKTLIRTSNSVSFVSQAVRALLLNYNWRRVAIVRFPGQACDINTGGYASVFASANINIVSILMINYNDSTSMKAALSQLKSIARISIICGGTSTPESALPFLSAAYENNMRYPEYVYIIPEFKLTTLKPWEPWLQPNVTPENVSYYTTIYRGIFTIRLYGLESEDFKNFSDDTANFINHNASYQDLNYTIDANLYMSAVYDALYLYGIAINKTVSLQLDPYSGINIMDASRSAVYMGASGKVTMDPNCEKVPMYKGGQVQKSSGNPNYFMVLGINTNLSNNFNIQILSTTGQPIWNTSDGKPTPDVPICGFNNEFCEKSYTTWYIVGSIVAICFTSAVVGGIVYYRKHVAEASLFQSNWKVDMKLFHHISAKNKSTRSRVASSNLESLSVNTTENDLEKNGAFEMSRHGCNAKAVGLYRGTMCMAKRRKKIGRIAFSSSNKQIFSLLKAVKEMSHDNLNTFVGLCIDDSEHFYSLWVYCPRGSLDDVLFNAELRIDETFQVSLIRDIISGIEFLHNSPIGFHGFLYSKNILVDGRWVAKITEFGMFQIDQELLEQRAIMPVPETPIEIMLCTAPEILRKEKIVDYKLVDIYHFGIISYKILYRKEPFDDHNASTKEILSLLKTLDFNGRPLRPLLKQVRGLEMKFLNLLEMCWRENAKTRTSASALKKEIFLQTRKFGKNLIDHIMNMLEKYATNLEKLVDERTEKMNEERRRADNLLYQILPKIVADALKAGQTVEPEIFETATVYFSDIVGFTTICSNSKPGEIIAMLNGLYSQFDQVILMFDAYKVETIGDAYLVVSGVPKRNGMEHVTNIAQMSLKILQALRLYRIPHMPFSPVNVRIGLHSGSVAGGVVGVTTPRYCLFGDAVNFASRMESTGEANKIHISENMFINLSMHPEFLIERRGQIEVKVKNIIHEDCEFLPEFFKGKGLCTTYWLLGKGD